MRQPPPWKKSGVRLPLAFSTIPFEAPPAEEQAHRLRLVFFCGTVMEMMLDFVFFYILSSKRGRRKSGRISCASNSFGGKVKELKLDIFFFFVFLRSAGGARAGASLVPVILIHCLSKFSAIASWRILFQNHAPRHRTTLSATVCAVCGRSPCNQGKLASSSTKTPLFFQGGWLHALCICFCLWSQSFSDLFQQYDLR